MLRDPVDLRSDLSLDIVESDVHRDPSTALIDQPEVGSYFVATYPPFSVWSPRRSSATRCRRCTRRPIPRRRSGSTCTSRSAGSAASSATSASTPTRTRRRSSSYLDVLAREWELYAQQPAIAGRPLNFVYFGGGTPSFLSTQQLAGPGDAADGGDAVERGRRDHVRVRARHADRSTSSTAIREMGVTRLSLGVENFDDRILELNGRAHRSPEIGQAYALRAGARLPADQHRPDRRHARRDRGELAALRREDDRRSSPTASPSTRWSCPSTRRSARTC